MFKPPEAASIHSPRISRARFAIKKGREMQGWEINEIVFAGVHETILVSNLLR